MKNVFAPLERTRMRLELEPDEIAYLHWIFTFRNTESRVLEFFHAFPEAPGFQFLKLTANGVTAAAGDIRDFEAVYGAESAAGRSAAFCRASRFSGCEVMAGPIEPGEVWTIEVIFACMLERGGARCHLRLPVPLGRLYVSRGPRGAENSAPSPVYAASGARPVDFELISHLADASDFAVGEGKLVPVGLAGDFAPVAVDPESDVELTFRRTEVGENVRAWRAGSRLFCGFRVPGDFVPPLEKHEVILLVDRSRSMLCDGVDRGACAALAALRHLTAEECFNVAFFSDGVKTLFDTSRPASLEHLEHAAAWIADEASHEVNGGTECEKALRKLAELNVIPGFTRSVLLVTDGCFYLPDRARTMNAAFRLFPLGVEPWNDRRTLDELARAAGTRCAFADTDERIEEGVFKQMNRIFFAFRPRIEAGNRRVRAALPYGFPGEWYEFSCDAAQHPCDGANKLSLSVAQVMSANVPLRRIAGEFPDMRERAGAATAAWGEIRTPIQQPELREIPSVPRRAGPHVSGGSSHLWAVLQAKRARYGATAGSE